MTGQRRTGNGGSVLSVWSKDLTDSLKGARDWVERFGLLVVRVGRLGSNCCQRDSHFLSFFLFSFFTYTILEIHVLSHVGLNVSHSRSPSSSLEQIAFLVCSWQSTCWFEQVCEAVDALPRTMKGCSSNKYLTLQSLWKSFYTAVSTTHLSHSFHLFLSFSLCLSLLQKAEAATVGRTNYIWNKWRLFQTKWTLNENIFKCMYFCI